MTITTPPLRWMGGKARMLKHILPLIPYSRSYVEPFGGVATVLLSRYASNHEVYNDMNKHLVNLFSVLRHRDSREELCYRLKYTLYSREEEMLSRTAYLSDDPIESAWGYVVRLNQGFGGLDYMGWGIDKQTNSMPRQFRRKADNFEAIADRMSNVYVENIDGIECIKKFNNHDTVFYMDPPYINEERNMNSTALYDKEVDIDWYIKFIDICIECDGAIALSGYDNPIFDVLKFNGWKQSHFETRCTLAGQTVQQKQDGNWQRPTRVECVWQNPRCLQMLNKPSLF